MPAAYGITTIEAFRATGETARRYLPDDIRKAEKMTFFAACLLPKLARHIPPRDQKVPEKNTRYTELDIPKALAKYAPSLSSIPDFSPPGQYQVNFTRVEIAIAASQGPPYVPYLAPKLSENPRMPSDSDHSIARTRWVSFSKQSKRSLAPQELAIQAFALYHLRFVFAADLGQAFQTFGGLGPQLPHFSTAHHLGGKESVGEALAYHRPVAQKLQGKSRKRAAMGSDFTALLSSEIGT